MVDDVGFDVDDEEDGVWDALVNHGRRGRPQFKYCVRRSQLEVNYSHFALCRITSATRIWQCSLTGHRKGSDRLAEPAKGMEIFSSESQESQSAIPAI